jgi:hypothetical protein
MTSNIDPSYPREGSAYTANVRSNFSAAQQEISALQDAVTSLNTQVSQLLADNATLKARTVAATNQTSDVPLDTNSPDFVTSGLDMLFQTTSSARAIFGIEGALGNDQQGNVSEVQLVWGTGNTAPPAGTLITDTDGTLTGTLVSITAPATGELPFAATALLTGMIPGDNYWIGVAYRSPAGGNVLLSACTITAFELLDPITP